jgi:hypothetical protein
MRRFLATLLALMVVAAPAGADPVRFHNPVLRVSATYDDIRWHVVNSVDLNTVLGLIWKTKHGANLAFCALQVAETPDASRFRGALASHKDHITLAIMADLRRMDPKAELIESRMASVGGRDVIRLRHKATIEGNLLFIETVETFRGSDEIRFDCGYPVPVADEAGPRLMTEQEINDVLTSLVIDP